LMKFNNQHVPESGSPVELWRGQVYIKSDFVIIRKVMGTFSLHPATGDASLRIRRSF